MEFSLFIGCNIPARVQQYELSARAVLKRIGVDVVDVGEFNCCGNPMRNTDFEAYILFSARNLALAQRRGLDLMVLCNCCYGSLKKADFHLRESADLKKEVNRVLEKEGLAYTGGIEVKHFLSVLFHEVGLPAIREKITRTFKDLKVATHYGCHVLRPSDVMAFDHPVAPVVFDQLVEATGSKSVPWPLKLECCGAPLLGINDDLSLALTRKKLEDGKASGAEFLCVSCPFCHMQFESVQRQIGLPEEPGGSGRQLPSILYPQLLGLAMEIDGKTLGIGMNTINMDKIEAFLQQVKE